MGMEDAPKDPWRGNAETPWHENLADYSDAPEEVRGPTDELIAKLEAAGLEFVYSGWVLDSNIDKTTGKYELEGQLKEKTDDPAPRWGTAKIIVTVANGKYNEPELVTYEGGAVRDLLNKSGANIRYQKFEDVNS